MANELTISASASYEKNNHELSFSPPTLSITVAGNEHVGGIQTLSTSEEALALNELDAASQGWAWFRNIGTDADSYVSVGVKPSSTFYECFRLKGGEYAIMRLGATALQAKSSTGELYLQYSILEP